MKIVIKKSLLSLCILIFMTLSLKSQENDTIVFSQGWMLTSLDGSLSNQYADVSSGESIITTGYRIGTKSGMFIKDNWVLGLNLSLSKTKFENKDIKIDFEDLLIGPWSRYYFAHKSSAALYIEITPHYTATYKQVHIIDKNGSNITNGDNMGKGFGVISGFGFTYVISKNVGFGISLSYAWAKVFMETKDPITYKANSSTYDVSELQLNFNFQIYLDQFFF